ncbi:hypothetical protein [Burkholderia sp. MBR-1]|uniref:hypothetical protein n=1 Tax=Burkholderia sp. MBR-1 TaxID=2732364 RepID=UPI0015EEB790|nr:hypothetical protein [Burkholderia sp. MBR-1]QMI49727.1 hypothetical protein MBR110_30090 [Burkholderia sp. MBR-1]
MTSEDHHVQHSICELDKEIIVAALNQMVNTGWVNICTIDRCLGIAQIVAPPDIHARLHALHCVEFARMPVPLREATLETIAALFRNGGLRTFDDLFGVSNQPTEAASPKGQRVISSTIGRFLRIARAG